MWLFFLSSSVLHMTPRGGCQGVFHYGSHDMVEHIDFVGAACIVFVVAIPIVLVALDIGFLAAGVVANFVANFVANVDFGCQHHALVLALRPPLVAQVRLLKYSSPWHMLRPRFLNLAVGLFPAEWWQGRAVRAVRAVQLRLRAVLTL